MSDFNNAVSKLSAAADRLAAVAVALNAGPRGSSQAGAGGPRGGRSSSGSLVDSIFAELDGAPAAARNVQQLERRLSELKSQSDQLRNSIHQLSEANAQADTAARRHSGGLSQMGAALRQGSQDAASFLGNFAAGKIKGPGPKFTQ